MGDAEFPTTEEKIESIQRKLKEVDWYEENIEEPIRDLVKYLRKNGVNTECSCCGHNKEKPYIQCQYIPTSWIKMVHDLLYNYLHKKNKKISYEIHVHHKVDDGHPYSSAEIILDE